MKKLLKFKWYLFGLAFLISLPISFYFLRQNNLKMIELRDVVLAVDKESGDISKTEPKITELRNYVLTHMNASLPNPLELPGSFNVALDQARNKAAKSGNVDAGIYNAAQAECDRQDVPLTVRAECIQNYVLTNSKAGSEPQNIKIPPKERFTYNFVSPSWSFDLAGLSVALSFTLFTIAWIKFVISFLYPKLTQFIRNQPYE